MKHQSKSRGASDQLPSSNKPLVILRRGDQYEFYGVEGILAARILRLKTFSQLSRGGSPLFMCQVPLQAGDEYIAQRLLSGYPCSMIDEAPL